MAYTVGSHLVFGPDQYVPTTERGGRLLAHELAHVVQQARGGGLRSQTSKAVSDPSDAAEREADTVADHLSRNHSIQIRQAPSAVAQRISLGEGLAIAGGVVGAALTIAYFAGAFDRSVFSETELKQYLDVLAGTHHIEDHRDSDNKARDLVRRWVAGEAAFNIDAGHRATAGALTGVELRRLLILEMLTGWTTGPDESAIIAILRRAQANDRQQLVTTIGRGRIWKSFSGQNRRIIEAITLNDGDFTDNALVERLKALPADELTDYRDNAVDPAVKARIVTIMQMQRITTPLDINTPLGAGGVAHLEIDGFDVSVLPDTTSQDEQFHNQANTGLGMDASRAVPAAFQDQSGVVQSSLEPEKIRVTIQTTYGPGTEPSGQSGYGRGTTEEDIAGGRTSVRFHEGNHGLDFLEFLRNNPAPEFRGQLGMTLAQWAQAGQQFQQAMAAYHERAVRFSLQRTECVGKAIPVEVARQYYHDAGICTDFRRAR